MTLLPMSISNPQTPPARTLKLTRPIGQTFGVALILLVGLILLSEMATRTSWAYTTLPTPSYRSPNPFLEAALLEAEIAVQSTGQIDCIFLGSSMVHTDYTPTDFADAYYSQTQKDLHCLDFGIPGLAANQAGKIAQAVVHKYQPHLIIFGTAARDYSAKVEQANSLNVNDLLDSPWLRYQLGEFSFQGWLLETFSSYRSFLAIRNSFQPVTNQTSLNSPPVDLTRPPTLDTDRVTFEMLADYELDPAGLAGLTEILNLADEQHQVVLVEMPVHPTYIYFFEHGQRDQEKFQQHIADLAHDHNILFWSTASQPALPDSLWHDRNHLNPEGAKVFSQWIGQRLAQTIQTGQLHELERPH